MAELLDIAVQEIIAGGPAIYHFVGIEAEDGDIDRVVVSHKEPVVGFCIERWRELSVEGGENCASEVEWLEGFVTKVTGFSPAQFIDKEKALADAFKGKREAPFDIKPEEALAA